MSNYFRLIFSNDILTESITDLLTDYLTDDITDSITDSITDDITEYLTDDITDQLTDEVTDPVIYHSLKCYTSYLFKRFHNRFPNRTFIGVSN